MQRGLWLNHALQFRLLQPWYHLTCIPVSANKKLSPSLSAGRFFPCFILGFLCVSVTVSSRADFMEDAARSLARRVAASLRGTPVILELKNLSDLKEQKLSELSLVFQEEMQRRGARILGEGNVKVHLTISNNVSEYLGVARVERNDSQETFIERLGQWDEVTTRHENEGLTLRRELIFSSDQPILDLIIADENPNHVEVLEPLQITSYERNGDRWMRGGSVGLPRRMPVGRNPKGQFLQGINEKAVVFQNEYCPLPIQEGETCRGSEASERTSEVPNRSLEGGKYSPWITTVEFPSEGKRITLAAGQGGKIGIYDDKSRLLSTFAGFGDQLSTIQTNCASGWVTLTTLGQDSTQKDSVQGIEFRDLKPVMATQALPLEGPVVALHQKSVTSAIAIVFNLRTGLYEAHKLTITCAS